MEEITIDSSTDQSLPQTTIQQFYANGEVFITGGTGFLGKILIEKLLRTCPDLKSIFLLVRSKKDKDVHTRVEEIFDDEIFDLMKQKVPKFRHKIQGIAGDCALPDLGLNNSDRQLLISKVNIVFHVAATVRFDEKLKLATAINVQATRDIIQLCKEMTSLKSVIHVSTAYSNCPQPEIDEKFYQPPMDADKMLSFVNAASEKLLDKITPTILDKWPNTYAFTKAIAEDVIKQHSGDLPIGMFRPAIVISTYKEPIPGWINNLYGPTGVAAGASSGFIKTLRARPDAVANLVPVDMCVNALIASAWDVVERRKIDEKTDNEIVNIPVYNYVCDRENQITWKDYMHQAALHGLEFPTIRAIWYYSLTLQPNKYLNLLNVYMLHLLPALLVDGMSMLFGKKPKVLDMYRKIHKFSQVIEYFTMNDWIFGNDNVRSLWDKLSKADQSMYNFDMRRLDWEEYYKTYYLGMRQYILKDPISTIDDARVRWNRLYWIHQITKGVFAACALRLTWAIISRLR